MDEGRGKRSLLDVVDWFFHLGNLRVDHGDHGFVVGAWRVWLDVRCCLEMVVMSC